LGIRPRGGPFSASSRRCSQLREILDHAATLEEAVDIVQHRDVFDQDVHTLSHHILIADAAGRSAIAEYTDGGWRIMENEKPWQIVTNTRLYGMTEEWMRSRCRAGRCRPRVHETSRYLPS